jgi:hypothetical protein
MQVETYECEETAAEEPECTDEALKLIEYLGLEGQRMLVNGEKKTRSPYRVMTDEENFVFRTLCPGNVTLAEYSLSPIPLRILQVAAYAKETGMFKELRVWHAKSSAVKDPVLVGIGPPEKGEYRDRKYILARWGDVLDEFPALIKQATRAACAAMKTKLLEAKAEIDGKLASVDSFGSDKLAAEQNISLYFRWID